MIHKKSESPVPPDLLQLRRQPQDYESNKPGYDNIFVWEVNSRNLIRRLQAGGQVESVAFSPDSQSVFATTDNGYIKRWNVGTGELNRSIKLDENATWIGILPAGSKAVAAGVDGKLTFWDYAKGTIVAELQVSQNSFRSAAISPNGKWLVLTGDDGTDAIVDLRQMALVTDVITYGYGPAPALAPDWLVLSGDLRFDARTIEDLRQVSWIASDQPFTALSPEIFMRDYYEPRLLPRLLACHEAEDAGDTGACVRAFKPVRPLAGLNRIQPNVRIVRVRRGELADEALVDVEASGKVDALQKNGKTSTAAYDLRLFRDGQIVGQWPEPAGGISGAEDIGRWQQASLVPSTADGAAQRHTFKVKLAHRERGKPVALTAYAFNEDRVKSETASDASYKVPDDVTPSAPRAYVVTIGVNAYENPQWHLGFAARDAKDLSKALKAIEGYEVVPVPLVSMNTGDGAKLDQATKGNIADVLALLGGHEEHRERLRQAIGPIVDKLRAATPDDLVILAFSGHGYTASGGRFYLLPSDSGTSEAFTDDVLAKFISSDELSGWLRDVDGGEMVMVIDACHSAASVPAGFKPGPMGDRGLGQLAYDKGMRILAATQADNVALESEKLGQGLLTYALVEDGLKAGKAAPDGGGPITMKSWLTYAEKRVPELYDDIQAGRLKAVQTQADDSATKDISKDPVINPAFRDQIVNTAQTPALFDFDRNASDIVIGGK
ncbi:caspase family protein [Rhizobium ruizarguesonis]|uniref:caspase family protein n=1 Tax=Rhizobium ruizarguesonis TaxID=2081791 RepID=UPI0037183D7D